MSKRHVLIPLDSTSDVEWVVRHAAQLNRLDPLRVTLLSVQTPLSVYVTRFLEQQAVTDFHRENGMALIAPVARRLDHAGIENVARVLVGAKAETIVRCAGEERCARIVLPRHVGLLTGLGFGKLGTLGTQLRHLVGSERACEISEAF